MLPYRFDSTIWSSEMKSRLTVWLLICAFSIPSQKVNGTKTCEYSKVWLDVLNSLTKLSYTRTSNKCVMFMNDTRKRVEWDAQRSRWYLTNEKEVFVSQSPEWFVLLQQLSTAPHWKHQHTNLRRNYAFTACSFTAVDDHFTSVWNITDCIPHQSQKLSTDWHYKP